MKSDETQSVDVFEGRFCVLLGSLTELTDDVFSDTGRYVGITIESEVQTPRVRLTTSPMLILEGPHSTTHTRKKASGSPARRFWKANPECN